MGKRDSPSEMAPILLMQGDTLLGNLFVSGSDMFWFRCDFVPTLAYDAIRPEFEEYARLRRDAARTGQDIADRLQQARNRIERLGLRLIVDGHSIAEFLLWIDGADAGVRYDLRETMVIPPAS